MQTTPEFESAYKGLNKAQKRAVDTIDGPVMVIAGPGTGKTQVLSIRVGNILKKTDISPGNILCLTFTDAAAMNMRERLAALIGTAGYKVAVHTFHGFAREVINDHPEFFYDGADFLPSDELARIAILEAIFGALPRNNPLASSHDGVFTYLNAAKSAIGSIKKAGLTPSDFSEIIERNATVLPEIDRGVASVFTDRISKKTIDDALALVNTLSESSPSSLENETPSLLQMVSISLAHAVERAHKEEKSTPLSEWKEKWTRRNDDGERVFKDSLYTEKMRALAHVYAEYRKEMFTAKLYDFDDMILDVLEELHAHPSLLSALEERYQYILVDEFQDTNDAQLKLIRLLGSAAVNEGKPNIMIVGDDDQAIYRFQGAEISNILDFPKHYATHELVVLTENYRSTQHILDVAREVIVKSTERLERVIPTLEKKLIAARPELGQGEIRHAVLPTRTHEHTFIAKEIARLIEAGTDPREIAVITRRHRELEDIARVLVAANIPITYERKQNVFDEPHIRALVSIARFVASIVRSRESEADEYLPSILSEPFWGLAREDIWRVSVAASRRDDRKWLGAMSEDTDPKVRAIAGWLKGLGAKAVHEPLERMLDEMIGSDGTRAPSLDGEDHDASLRDLSESESKDEQFISPFRDHYFGTAARIRAEARYLLFLSSLRVFVSALREYKHGAPLFIGDLVEFADLHERNNITLADTTPFSSAAHSVNVVTVHSAKGREFDTVFVASCQEDVWAGKGKGNLLPFPANLPITPEDGDDDHLRIFYVALTRAKKHLYLSSYRQNDAGKQSIKASYLIPDASGGAIARHFAETEMSLSDRDLAGSIGVLPTHPEFFPIVPGERAILLELIKEYRMSVTHLNNFLNVTKGGPAVFLEQNLLRFPHAMSPHLAYGDAMHKGIERFYRELRRTGKVPTAEKLVGYFVEFMEQTRLPERERLHFQHSGEEMLPVWWQESGRHADRTHHSEIDFRGQGVVIEGAMLSGKIDKMVEDGNEMLVVDFKTGRPKLSWEGKDPEEKIRLMDYRRQLLFYKLLVEHSHDYAKYAVHHGTLEFLESNNGTITRLDMETTEEEADRLSALIGIVYKKIMALDFPDIAKYSKDAEGIKQFENDLLGEADL